MKVFITVSVGIFLVAVIQHILGIKVTSNVIPEAVAIVVNFTICGLVGLAIAIALDK
jgi:hypothetical protein